MSSTTSHFQILSSRFSQGFSSLSTSPPELKYAYVLKFLDSFAYFSYSIIFTLFATSDFGFSDYHAGTLYGAWGALVTLFGLANGFIISQTIKWGSVIQIINRGV